MSHREAVKDSTGKTACELRFKKSQSMNIASIQPLYPRLGQIIRRDGKRWKCVSAIRVPCEAGDGIIKTESKWIIAGRDYRKQTRRRSK